LAWGLGWGYSYYQQTEKNKSGKLTVEQTAAKAGYDIVWGGREERSVLASDRGIPDIKDVFGVSKETETKYKILGYQIVGLFDRIEEVGANYYMVVVDPVNSQEHRASLLWSREDYKDICLKENIPAKVRTGDISRMDACGTSLFVTDLRYGPKNKSVPVKERVAFLPELSSADLAVVIKKGDLIRLVGLSVPKMIGVDYDEAKFDDNGVLIAYEVIIQRLGSASETVHEIVKDEITKFRTHDK